MKTAEYFPPRYNLIRLILESSKKQVAQFDFPRSLLYLPWRHRNGVPHEESYCLVPHLRETALQGVPASPAEDIRSDEGIHTFEQSNFYPRDDKFHRVIGIMYEIAIFDGRVISRDTPFFHQFTSDEVFLDADLGIIYRNDGEPLWKLYTAAELFPGKTKGYPFGLSQFIG